MRTLSAALPAASEVRWASSAAWPAAPDRSAVPLAELAGQILDGGDHIGGGTIEGGDHRFQGGPALFTLGVVAFGGAAQVLALAAACLEHQQRLTHGRDLVAPLANGDDDVEIAVGQRMHDLGQRAQRLGDAAVEKRGHSDSHADDAGDHREHDEADAVTVGFGSRRHVIGRLVQAVGGGGRQTRRVGAGRFQRFGGPAQAGGRLAIIGERRGHVLGGVGAERGDGAVHPVEGGVDRLAVRGVGVQPVVLGGQQQFIGGGADIADRRAKGGGPVAADRQAGRAVERLVGAGAGLGVHRVDTLVDGVEARRQARPFGGEICELAVVALAGNRLVEVAGEGRNGLQRLGKGRVFISGAGIFDEAGGGGERVLAGSQLEEIAGAQIGLEGGPSSDEPQFGVGQAGHDGPRALQRGVDRLEIVLGLAEIVDGARLELGGGGGERREGTIDVGADGVDVPPAGGKALHRLGKAGGDAGKRGCPGGVSIDGGNAGQRRLGVFRSAGGVERLDGGGGGVDVGERRRHVCDRIDGGTGAHQAEEAGAAGSSGE